MKKIIISGIVMAVATLPCLPVKGQGKVVPFKYGNMDHWVVRNIKESGIIGGNQKTVYAVGPNMTVNGNIPYTNKGGSPWGPLMSWHMYRASIRRITLCFVINMVVDIVPNW